MMSAVYDSNFCVKSRRTDIRMLQNACLYRYKCSEISKNDDTVVSKPNSLPKEHTVLLAAN